MRAVVTIRYGSHLYGTATPSSDLDLKAVHVPDGRDILLGSAKGSLATRRAKAEGEKNVAGEADEESYSLLRYLTLLAEGQTVALDLLFAPPAAMLHPPEPEWHEIVANRQRLVTSKSAAFIGYCRQQANKYGIKGSRVAAARRSLAVLDEGLGRLGVGARLRELAPEVEALARALDHVAVVPVRQVDGSDLAHFEVCGRKLSYAASIKSGRDVVARLVEEYGHRALQAEQHEGADWKALSHAVRVARQGLELLRTGRVTFPLPDAARILSIKLGEVPYQAVAEEIEALLADVEREAPLSVLPREPDRTWIDDFVAAVYRREVCRSG